MQRFITGISSLLLLCTLTSNAQFKNVKIAEGQGRHAPEEPSIMINGKNSDNIFVGANIHNAYVSNNGGSSWTKVKVESELGVAGDPCIITDKKGNFYFFHLASQGGDSWLDRIVCQRSKDGGKTWTNGTGIGLNGSKDQDKEWAVVDPKSGDIYVTWTQFDKYDSTVPTDSTHILFSKSTNKGKTFSEPVRINQFGGDCIDKSTTVEGAVPAVGPNGEIYVAWSLNDYIYFDKSLDGGKTWLDKDIIAVTETGGWEFEIEGIMRSNGFPVTVCDLSDSKHRGTIYINWSDKRNGLENTDIWLTKSTDGGQTWSAPRRVNDDKTQTEQFFNWMAIDQSTGYLYVIFYDRRNSEDVETEVYLAVSRDGGETFVNTKISESPFTPEADIFFGDYNNISVQNGMVRPIWTRLEDGTLSIWTALIHEKDLPKK